MKRLLLWATFMALSASPAQAHEGHAHESSHEVPPHGGNLRAAGDLKGEIVISGDTLKLYLYDKVLKPLKIEKTELKGEVQFPKEKSKPVSFKKKGEFYEATLKGISKTHRYDLHINVEQAGKKTVLDFGVDNI